MAEAGIDLMAVGISMKNSVVSSFLFCFRSESGWPSWPPSPLPQLKTVPSLMASVCNPPQEIISKMWPFPARIPP